MSDKLVLTNQTLRADPAPLTDEELVEIRARTDAATAHPWRAQCLDPAHEGWRVGYYENGAWFSIARVITWEGGERDATFIAHAREAVPRLIADLQATRAELERLRTVLEERGFVRYEMTEDGCVTTFHDARPTTLSHQTESDSNG